MPESQQSARALVGTVLEGAYKLTRLVGEGGMGAVYQATQLRLEKRVAVKVMARELAYNEEALARFRREVQVTSQLAHPHIVHVSDFGTTPHGQPFLVMEFLDGEDLADRLSRVGRLPLASVVTIVNQVSSALGATHGKGIVHRDLKPENLFLLKVEGVSDFVKVVDFGISKVKSSDEKLTRASRMIGTPSYMAPEQALGKVDAIDHRTDQWALACIAWEMLSGTEPFVAKDQPTLFYAIAHGELPPMEAPGIPPDVEAVLRRALSKKQGERFPTISAFARAFGGAVTPTAVVIATPRPVLATPRPFKALTPAIQRLGTVIAGVMPRRKRKRPGLVDHTIAMGRRAVEEFLPQRKKRPRHTVAWVSAAAVGVSLAAGAFFFYRPFARPPAVIKPAAPVVAPAPEPEPVKPPPTRRERRRH